MPSRSAMERSWPEASRVPSSLRRSSRSSGLLVRRGRPRCSRSGERDRADRRSMDRCRQRPARQQDWVHLGVGRWACLATATDDQDAALYDVIAGDGVIVAVGASLDAEMNATAAAWSSTDGATWERATVAGSDGASMGPVATTPTGFVATGDRRLGATRPLWVSETGDLMGGPGERPERPAPANRHPGLGRAVRARGRIGQIGRSTSVRGPLD